MKHHPYRTKNESTKDQMITALMVQSRVVVIDDAD